MSILSLQKNIIGILCAVLLLVQGFSSIPTAEAYALANNIPASYVIGDGSATQDFTDSDSGITATTFNSPQDIVYDNVNDRLFVGDRENNRVLVFNTDASGLPLDYTADYVLGQPDFVSNTGALDQDSLTHPKGLAYDATNEYLFVADNPSMGRVLVFDVRSSGSVGVDICSNGTTTTGIANGMNASCVIGQANFTSGSATTAQNQLKSTGGITIDPDNNWLYVRDSYRVVIFDLDNLADGMNAFGMIGQSNFTNEETGTSSTRFGVPLSESVENDIVFDATNDLLFVGDRENGRVLVFDATDGNAIADYVLGQVDFTSDVDGGVTASTFDQFGTASSIDLFVDETNNRLFVGDTIGSRIMVFDLDNLANNMNADYALGQPDLTTGTSDTNQYGFQGTRGGYFNADDNLFYASDYLNHRILIFNLTAPTITHTTTFTESSPNNGSLDGSSIATITNDTFINAGSTLTENTHYTITNAPAGLTPVMTINGAGTTATLTFTGNATNHESANNVSNLTITFLDGAFTTTATASDATGYIHATGTITFDDAPASSGGGGGSLPTPESETCELTAQPTTINQGEQAILSWDTDIPTGYYTVAEIDPLGDVNGDDGQITVSPTQTTTYEATFDGSFIGYVCKPTQTITVIIPQEETEEIEVEEEPDPLPVPEDTTPTDLIEEEIITNPEPVEETEVVTEETPDPLPTPVPTDTSPTESQSIPQESSSTSPFTSPLTKAITTIGFVAGLLVTALTTAFAGPLTATELVLIPTRLWSLFLSALGIKKKDKPWGVVYDAHTKRPLDPVYLTLTNTTTKEEYTAITDMDGRYSFLVTTPGTYTITAGKADYQFPSQTLKGKTSDHLYQNLYFGEPFKVTKQGHVITKNIPMDNLTFNWNEQDKIDNDRLKFFKKRDYILTKVGDILYTAGFAITIVAVVVSPVIYNIATLALYILLAFVRSAGLKYRKHASATDTHGNPIPHALVTAYSIKLNREIKHTIADTYGRFHMLLPNGTYKITIQKPLDQDTYETVKEYERFEVEGGVVRGFNL